MEVYVNQVGPSLNIVAPPGPHLAKDVNVFTYM